MYFYRCIYLVKGKTQEGVPKSWQGEVSRSDYEEIHATERKIGYILLLKLARTDEVNHLK